MKRITIKDIEKKLEYLNELTNNPLTPYTRKKDGKFIANIGNFHTYQSYGSIKIYRMYNEGGGVTEIIPLSTKRECYNRLNSLIKGIHIARETHCKKTVLKEI